MTMLPAVAPPLPTPNKWARALKTTDPMNWLALGWQGFNSQPALSVAYGVVIFLISAVFVGGLFAFNSDYILFPAFAGFMVIGPILAVGLYEKSRRLGAGLPFGWRNLVFVRPRSGGQILFTGVLLCLLMMVWMRAAG